MTESENYEKLKEKLDQVYYSRQGMKVRTMTDLNVKIDDSNQSVGGYSHQEIL